MYEEHLNKKYNEWTIVKFSHKDKHNHPFFECVCSCGNKNTIDLFSLKYNRSKCCKQCGYKKIKGKHNLSHSRIYRTFNHIKQRCLNPNDSKYKDYGGRGIKICKEWCEEFNLNKGTIYNRITKYGYTPEEALTKKLKNGKFNPLLGA